MELKLIKNNDVGKYFLVYANTDVEIESYDLTNSIDFSKLMNTLIQDELKNKYTINECDFEKNDEESVLFNLIKSILEKYNENVDKFLTFKMEENLNSSK